MQVNTADLSGRALAYAVGIAERCRVEYWHTKSVAILFPGAVPRAVPWNPHTDWSQGGVIIERAEITIVFQGGVFPKIPWNAQCRYSIVSGPTPLIAAMRCYVASKLGDTVDIPEELS